MNMKFNLPYNILTFSVFCLISSCQNSDTYLDLNNNGKKDVYEDPNLDSYARAESIVAELSVVEKISQLESNAPAINTKGTQIAVVIFMGALRTDDRP